MKKPIWVVADDDGKWNDRPTPHSGGENKQLGGYDARNRAEGPLKKPDGKHVPADKGWKNNKNASGATKSPLQVPVEPKKWTKKYL